MNLSYILLHGAPLALGLLIGLFLESKSKFMFSATIDPHIMDILMRDIEKIHEETYFMTDIPEELITEKAPEIKTPHPAIKIPVLHTKRIIKLPKLRRNQTKSLRTQILAKIQKQQDDILERRQKIINRLAAKIWKPLSWVKQI